MIKHISLTALAFLAGMSQANAGGFGFDYASATAQGQGFAGAAAGTGGIGSMAWNPAAVTLLPGANTQFNLSVVDLDSRITPGAGTSPLLGTRGSGDIGQTALVPSSYLSYQINDRLFVGLSSTVPFGAISKPDHEWAGNIYSQTSRIRAFNFNPVIGYRVTDWLSVAAGPAIEFMQVRLARSTSFLPGAPSAQIRMDDLGVGFTLGAILTPAEGTVIGVGYRSSINHELSGTLNTGAFVLPVKTKLNSPDKVSVGLVQTLTPELRLSLGYEWTNWSRIGTLAYRSNGVPVADLPLNYRNGHLFSVGAEYDVDPRWTVRGGLSYEISPVTEAVRTTAIPDANRFGLSVGASYRYSDRLSFDLAYTHLFVEPSKVRISPGSAQLASAAILGLGTVPLSLVGGVDTSANVITAAIRYRFD